MLPDKHIIHMDQDAFFVSVEIRKDPSLIGKPVIIGDTTDRGVVASCSYEARKFGVRSAMPSRVARVLCPHAIFIRGSMEEYSKASYEVTDILRERVPLLEKASIDEHYIDMTGMDRFYGTLKYAHELRKRVTRETGLPISFGLSVNKTVSKMATNECKPNGELNVEKPKVQSFLNPLSIRKIPGLGNRTFVKLSDMGIKKIHALAQIHPDQIQALLGKNGLSLLQKARGIDHSPVVPYTEQKSIGNQCTFKVDTIDIASINSLIAAMVMELAFELRRNQKLTACVAVTIRYANFEDVTGQAAIPYTALDAVLIGKVQELFRQVYQKRMLVRMVGVRFSNLVNGYEQIGLFTGPQERYGLYQAMDRIRLRFGEKAVTIASTMNLEL